MNALPGGPRAGALLGEGLRTARSQKRQTFTVTLLVAAVCVAALLTAGRTAATERSVIASIDSIGTRLIVVTDTTGTARIHPDSVAAVQSLPGVTWAFGLGPATDAHNVALPQGAPAVPMRAVVGQLPPAITSVTGRHAAPAGQALVGANAATALGMPQGAGAVTDGATSATVVGAVKAEGPLDFLSGQVLLTPEPSDPLDVIYMYVVVDDAAHAEAMGEAITAALHAEDPDQIDVAVSSGALRLRDTVKGTLGASSRQLMAVLLASGMLTVAIATTGGVAARRRDFGRDRALGASRSAIVTGVLIHSGLAACLGAIVGTAVGLVAVGVTSEGKLPAPTFSAGLAIVTVLIALVGAAPPAVAAALRDPVRILRVP